jgi:hypothetical protein
MAVSLGSYANTAPEYGDSSHLRHRRRVKPCDDWGGHSIERQLPLATARFTATNSCVEHEKRSTGFEIQFRCRALTFGCIAATNPFGCRQGPQTSEAVGKRPQM